MTDLTREQIETLLDGTTPGPWRKRDCDVVVGEGLTAKTICHFWRHWSNDQEGLEQTEPNASLTAAAPRLARQLLASMASLAEAQAAQAVLRDFIEEFSGAMIEALRYSPPYGSSPEDEPDPVVDAETVWAWQTDAKDAIRAIPSATQAGGENQALRAMIRVNMLRYGPADLTHEDIDRQIEAAIAAFAPLPPAPEGGAQREEARKG